MEEKKTKGGEKRRLMVLLKVGFVSLSDAAAAQLSRASVSALPKTRFGPV